MTAACPIRIVVDADLGLPAGLLARTGILVAPGDVRLLLERENIPRLIVESGFLDAAPVVEACRAAAEGGADVIYVAAGDGHGHPEGAEALAREAVEAEGGRLLIYTPDDALMGAGWRAVIAAEAVAGGATAEAALARAQATNTRVLALVEHPELAGESTPGTLGTPSRIVTWLRGPQFALDSTPERREDALRRLRDRFAAAVAGDGEDSGGGAAPSQVRVAVQHGGVGPGAEAMATWIERHVRPAEVHAAAITRHAATRLGPGFIGIAWAWEP